MTRNRGEMKAHNIGEGSTSKAVQLHCLTR